MKQLLNISILLLSIFLFFSCDLDTDNCVRGKGPQEEYNLELIDFDAISVAGAVNIQLTQGSEYSSVLLIEPNLFQYIRFGVIDGELFIDQTDRCLNPQESITLRVTAPDFREITIAGASIVSSTNDLVLDELTVTCSGAVVTELTGTCTTQNLNVAGAGTYFNFDLASDDATLVVDGSGEFEVQVQNNLDITVRGSAIVNYKGNPTITEDVEGSLELNDAN